MGLGPVPCETRHDAFAWPRPQRLYHYVIFSLNCTKIKKPHNICFLMWKPGRPQRVLAKKTEHLSLHHWLPSFSIIICTRWGRICITSASKFFMQCCEYCSTDLNIYALCYSDVLGQLHSLRVRILCCLCCFPATNKYFSWVNCVWTSEKCESWQKARLEYRIIHNKYNYLAWLSVLIRWCSSVMILCWRVAVQ